MTLDQWFDVLLIGTLLWVVWRGLTTPTLFTAIVLFIVYGLLMSLAWIRLHAVDIALAEAAIGAGLSGALLLDAAGHMGERQRGVASTAGTQPPRIQDATEDRVRSRSGDPD
jgi:energy-converting hydrogenase B subunit D